MPKKRPKKKKKKKLKMTVSQLEKKIKSIIAEVTEVDERKIGLNTDFVKDLGMNSMAALEILATIERTCGIEVPEESLPEIKNLKNVIALTKKLVYGK